MKKLFTIPLLLSLAACGSADFPQTVSQINDPPPVVENPSREIAQPFIFEEVGDELYPSPIHLSLLPNGNWLVLNLDGRVSLRNSEFEKVSNDLIDLRTTPVYAHDDSGAMSLAVDPDYDLNRYIYIYYTMNSTASPCENALCNTVVRFTVDEECDHLLNDPSTIAVFPMVNRVGAHNGGGTAFGPDGQLYFTVGDGAYPNPPVPSSSQDLNSPLGKVFKFDPVNLQMEMVAAGLRNPFTMIPTEAGAVIGDVGNDLFEEVNLLPWESPLENFGWPLTEGPFVQSDFPGFSEPIHSFKHCEEKFKDEDPLEPEKALAIKNHNGAVHACSNELIAVAGYYGRREQGDPDPYQGALDGAVIYTDPYYGWIRAFDPVDGKAINDRHIAHFPGLVSCDVGRDGSLYCLSLFASHILKLVTVR